MNSRNLLFSAAHFFVIFFIFGVGALVLALPYADAVRIHVINSLLNPGDRFLYVGGGIIAFGLILFICLFALNRRRYLQMECKGATVQVEERVIRDCVSTYFSEVFPGQETVTEVVIQGKSLIELFVNLPTPQEETFFEQVEEELGGILARKLGYQAPFALTFVGT